MKKIIVPLVVALIAAAATVVAAYFTSDEIHVNISNFLAGTKSDSVFEQTKTLESNYNFDKAVAITNGEKIRPEFQMETKPEIDKELKLKDHQHTVQVEMIDFVLKSCKMPGQALALDFILENTSDSAGEIILYQARMIDDMGAEHNSNRIDIAKTGRKRLDLPSKVPVQMSISFDGVAEKIQTVKILEIKGSFSSSGSNRNIKVTLRDIPVH